MTTATNGHHAINGTSKWSEVTAADPCRICGKSKWCVHTDNFERFGCRHRTDSPVDPTYRFLETKPDGGGCDMHHWTNVEERAKQSRAVNYPPTGGETLAPPEILDAVYRAFLGRLPLLNPDRINLADRGLSFDQIKDRGYRSLDDNRWKGVTAVLDAGHEKHLASVPGFYVKELENGTKWSIGGGSGIAVPVRNCNGQIVAIKVRLREPLPDGTRYVYVSSKKKGGVGPGSPLHYPLGIPDFSTTRITEGELKADVTTSLSGIATVSIPGVASWNKGIATIVRECKPERILIAIDADWKTKKEPCKAVVGLVAYCRKESIQFAIEDWDLGDGKGIDDLLKAEKSPRIVEGEAVDALLGSVSFAESTEKSQSANKDPFTDPNEDRPKILLSMEEWQVADETIAALAERDDSLFQRGLQLVQIVNDASVDDGIDRQDGSPRIMPVPLAGIRERMTKSAIFFTETTTEKGEYKCSRKRPEDWLVRAVHYRGQWQGIRPLVGVVNAPVLRPDGTIIDSAGYDARTGLVYQPTVEVPPIPTNPSADDIRSAVSLLIGLVVDFPFAGDAHRSTWIAHALTVLARSAFPGPSPFTQYEANVRGAGKSLLNDLVAIITIGREASRMACPDDDAEFRKSILSIAIAGDRMVLIDNIAGTFGFPALDAALTGTTWQGRLLGRSETVSLPLLVVWSGSGNNIILRGDICRRTANCRLNSLEENPENREGFTHENVKKYCRANRGPLIAAALTILRGFFAAGCPDQHLRPWGSFEGWSSIVRNAIVWAGLADPGDTRQELQQRSDTEAQSLRTIISILESLDPRRLGTTSAELVRLATEPRQYDQDASDALREALLQLCPVRTGFPNSCSIGRKLHHLLGRNVDGKALVSHKKKNVVAWTVAAVENEPFSNQNEDIPTDPDLNPTNLNPYGESASRDGRDSRVFSPSHAHAHTYAHTHAQQRAEQPDQDDHPDYEDI